MLIPPVEVWPAVAETPVFEAASVPVVVTITPPAPVLDAETAFPPVAVTSVAFTTTLEPAPVAMIPLYVAETGARVVTRATPEPASFTTTALPYLLVTVPLA